MFAALPGPGGGPAASAGPVLSFVAACGGRPARVEFEPAVTALPPARPRDANVEVFLAGSPPSRRYVPLGSLRVTATHRRMSLANVLELARAEARRRGGDALIEVLPAPAHQRSRPPVMVTAWVVRWT